MVGKTWSVEEEAYFWVHVVPFSRHRRGVDIANPELTFQQLGEKMQTALGKDARRQYTGLCIEEHFYQNVKSGAGSRNARKWVKKYKALAEEYPGRPEKSTRAMHEVNGEVEGAHVSTKPGAEMDWELGGDENAVKRQLVLKMAQVVLAPGTGKGKRKRSLVGMLDEPVGKGKRVEAELSAHATGATTEHTPGETIAEIVVCDAPEGDIQAAPKETVHSVGTGHIRDITEFDEVIQAA